MPSIKPDNYSPTNSVELRPLNEKQPINKGGNWSKVESVKQIMLKSSAMAMIYAILSLGGFAISLYLNNSLPLTGQYAMILNLLPKAFIASTFYSLGIAAVAMTGAGIAHTALEMKQIFASKSQN